jgi:type II secretory pathway pseudopilin PulG
MKHFSSVVMVIATMVTIAVTNPASAQDRARTGAIYDAASSVRTNIDGIRTFAAPPAGFDAINETDEALATYGFPPRPNKDSDPVSFAKWARAMAASKVRWNGELQHTGAYSRPGARAAAPAGASANPATAYYYNWSGFVNTNTLTKYNTKTSFYYIVSDFNVPAVTVPSCDGGWDWEVSWNGIDGNQDGNALLQGGSSSQAYCSGTTNATNYYAWVEWFPAYDIIKEFAVNPGDDLFVETWDTSATQGYVYLVDETTGTSGIYGLTPNGGAGLIGNSAEYIVERPCCRTGTNDYPLANYVWNFWANSYAFNFITDDEGKATTAYPGSTAATTILVDMVNDQDNDVISAPTAQGKYGIFFEAEGCTTGGGCIQ